MHSNLAAVIERMKDWPEERQAEAAELLLALDELGPEPVDVDDATLAAIDDALAQVQRGELADTKEVEAMFARYRK